MGKSIAISSPLECCNGLACVRPRTNQWYVARVSLSSYGGNTCFIPWLDLVVCWKVIWRAVGQFDIGRHLGGQLMELLAIV